MAKRVINEYFCANISVKDNGDGKFNVPGGFYDRTDLSNLQSVLNEILEELSKNDVNLAELEQKRINDAKFAPMQMDL